ncbi:MAG TPA: TonB family protein [Blastocatellia bacterium]|nr:TonB family protein [Blastocatellia bacterium]
MSERLFETFDILEGRPLDARPRRIGASISFLFHLLLFGVMIWVSPKTMPTEQPETEVVAQGAPPHIIELDAPLYALPPEVVRQLAAVSELTPPRRAEYLSEKETIARGERNPTPQGSSSLPKVSGGSGRIASLPSSPPAESPSERETGARRRAVEKPLPPTLPSATAQSAPLSGNSDGLRESFLAALRGASPLPLPEVSGAQQSGVTLEGPPSVNARAAEEMEQYRRYLEREIQQRWFIPPEAHLLTSPTTVIIIFEVARDGKLLQIRLKQSSGFPALDRAALNAVRLAAPFRPLPSAFLFTSQVFTDKFTYFPPRG